MATTKIRSSSITDGQVANADLSATVAVTGGQIADDAVTLAKMAGGTDGNLITYDASGDPAYVATGAATNVLTSNGAGAAPTFQAAAAGGKVLQVIQTVKTDTTSTTAVAGAFADMTGMTVAITPSAATSKVLVLWNIDIGATDGWRAYVRLMRDAATPLLGDAAGSRIRVTTSAGSPSSHAMASSNMTYLDSPSTTSSVTYKLQWSVQSAGTVYLNRQMTDPDSDIGVRTASTITVMEIGA